MIWLTADLHFNHINILKYEPISRQFETLDEMKQSLRTGMIELNPKIQFMFLVI